MELGFGGEIVDLYHKYRRGYSPAVIDALVEAFALTKDDAVVDIGCGTGQLTMPIAERVRAVVGVDPEPDMLTRARLVGRERGMTNISWMLAADTDLPALGALLGDHTLGAATIGQALHWMDHRALFRTLTAQLRPGGGIAVVANGTPLWLQDTTWSRALRGVLERWLGRPLTQTCGTDTASQRRYAEDLGGAGFHVHHAAIDYADEITLDQLLGGVYSAFSAQQLPARDQRLRFAEVVREALHPQDRFSEHVRVAIIIGRVP